MPNSAKTPVPERLLQAAVDVFGARGYHAARVSDIVGRAGVAQGTFYLYFQNKEAIFLHLIDDFFGRLLGETLGGYPAGDIDTVHELKTQFQRMWRMILSRCRREPMLTTLVLRESYALGPASRSHVEERFGHVVAAISDYLKDLSNRGLIHPGVSERSAWSVLGIIERAIHYAVVVDPESEIDELVEEFSRMELTGLLGFPALSAERVGSEADGARFYEEKT